MAKERPAAEKKAASHRDLTQGGILRTLIPYAIPLIVSSLLQSVYGMVDMVVAGHFIGSSGLSAINNASQITNLLASIAIGLSTGGSIVVGQLYGAKEDAGREQAAGTLLTFTLLAGIGVMVLLGAFGHAMLRLLGAPSLAEATDYLMICAAGMAPVFGYNALSAILRVVGNSRRPFICIAVATVLNILLDLLFVGPLSMGTAGAALATVIAQVVAFGMALGYMLRHPEIMRFTRDVLRIRGVYLRKVLRVGIPSVLQSTIASVSWLTVTALVNSYGQIVSAGNGVSIKIKELCQRFISAMASAATAMIAQNLGAEKYDRARDIMYASMRITVFMAVLIIAIVEPLAPQLAGLFTSDPAVIDAAVLNLRIEIVGQLFYAMFLIYHALAIGAGHTTFAMMSSFVNCIVFRLVLSLLLNHFFGLRGLYVACMVAPSISVPLGWLYTRSGAWRRRMAG